MPLRKASVLVVDDDVRLLRLMSRTLELEGYRVLTAVSGESAMEMLDEEIPDLVLLDIRMPGIDGHTVCRRIREFSQIPIILVSVNGNEEDKVNGLDGGADDYVTKPFSSKELAARARAVLRRNNHQNEHSEPTFNCRDLTVDFARHRVALRSQEINLTATEYGLLSYLACNAGCVLTPDQILEAVWGEAYLGETHLLQVNVARLRHKLGDDSRNPKYIMTRHGLGYTMTKDPSTA